MSTNSALRPAILTSRRLELSGARRVLFVGNAILLAAVLVVLYTTSLGTSTMRVGSVAGETIMAQRRVSYIDHLATQARKRQARQSMPAVYVVNTKSAVKREREVVAFFDRAAPIINSGLAPTEKLKQIRAALPADVSPSALQEFASLTPPGLQIVQARSLALLTQAQGWHFDSNQVTATEIGLLSTVSSRVTVLQRAVIGEVLSTFLAPTLVTDPTATLQRQREAAAAIKPVVSTVYAGEVVVRRGDLVTPSVMEKLAALGLQQRRSTWQDSLASVLFSLLIVSMLFWYLAAFHPGISANGRVLLFIDAATVATVIGARVLAPSHVLLPYFLPAAAAPTFAAVLMAPEAAIMVGFCIAILAGWIAANSFELTLYYFLTATAGVLAVRRVLRLKQFVVAGLFIAAFAMLTMLCFGLVAHNYDLVALQDFALAAAVNGFVSCTFALAGFALLAEYFGVTTTLQLLELGQPHQPLLRRLMVGAPGTHNHSLIVASMVERAAEEIGADSLIAKLGALYHDVGKTVNPHCFIENQLGIGNIHDELRPDESARLIRSHVVQGLRLAKHDHLPRPVLDAITEHHGTMPIGYFLHQAREFGDDQVDVSLYTYPGPKPQSKETALLMLADGCESAVRASGDHSADGIRQIVDRIFRERLEYGQLSDSPLTLRDLELARDAFLSVLNGLYHPRIEYPEAELLSRPVLQ